MRGSFFFFFNINFNLRILPQPSKCWDYSCVPLYVVSVFSFLIEKPFTHNYKLLVIP
ncbi:hypothetical protein ACRRTK_020147 [Alexandromys fortis]